MTESWKFSLHGGHSGDFCGHGKGTLRAFLIRAIEFGYSTFGVACHAPRPESKYMSKDELDVGLTPNDLFLNFTGYAVESKRLQGEFAGRLEVLRGVEAECVPSDRYVQLIRDLEREYDLDYIVGSVHWVHDVPIDESREELQRAAEISGGLEALAIDYYRTLAKMINDLRPNIVGHIDVLRKFAGEAPELATKRVKAVAYEVLDVCAKRGTMIEVNVRGYDQGLVTPYPDRWLLLRAHEAGIPISLGDDSHSPESVGQNMERGRNYLISLGIQSVTKLVKNGNAVMLKPVSLVN